MGRFWPPVDPVTTASPVSPDGNSADLGADMQVLAQAMVRRAHTLNRQCGLRAEQDGSAQPYAGFSVDDTLLESAIYATFQVVGGSPRYPGIFDRAAALLVRIARNHPFGDGNKRTSLHLAVYYLWSAGIRVIPPDPSSAAQVVIDAVDRATPLDEAVRTVSTAMQSWPVQEGS